MKKLRNILLSPHSLKTPVLILALAGIALPACRYTELHERRLVVSGAATDGSAREAVFQGHTVLVQDAGFDLTNTVFKDKILGSYTFRCWNDPVALASIENQFEAAQTAAGSSLELYDAARAEYYISLENLNEKNCEVTEGVNASTLPSFDRLRPNREAWNEAIVGGRSLSGIYESRFPELGKSTPFVQDLNGEIADAFHGTSTAGLIASDNPNVRLVIVDDQRFMGLGLKDPIEEGIRAGNPNSPSPACPNLDFYADEARLFSNPSFLKRYVERPISAADRQFADLVKQHGVGMMNRSFGKRFTRPQLERPSAGLNCDFSHLAAYFKARGEAFNKRKVFVEDTLFGDLPFLEVKAAGNSGYKVDSFADQLDCRDPTRLALHIGSMDLDGSLSDFSDHGACVDGFALGSQMILSSAEDFLYVDKGTSFSAPMVVRSLTMNQKPAAKPAELRAYFLAQLDANTFQYPKRLQSTELVYQPKSVAIRPNSLALDGEPALASWGARTLPSLSYRHLGKR